MIVSNTLANRLAATYLMGLAALLAVGVAFTVRTVVPYNAAHRGDGRYVWFNFVLPQGWAFFTRDPREERASVFGLANGQWHDVLRTPHSRPINAFGMNRASRAQGTEMAILAQQVPVDAWHACRTTDVGCLDLAVPPVAAKNPGPDPTMCGQIGIVLRSPVPWAWSKDANVVMRARAARLEVAC